MLRKLALGQQSALFRAGIKEVSKVSTCFASSGANAEAVGEEVRIPVPWGHIAGKWWGPKTQKPIFTFHGWQDNCGSFDLLIPVLPKHISFLTLDFPGHGHSSRLPAGMFYHNLNGIMLIRRLQAYFNFEKISLLGHSLGAITSYTYAGFYPQAVDFVICIDGLTPLLNPKRLDRVTQTVDAFLKYDGQVVSMLNGGPEPPVYTYETMVEMMHKGTRGAVDKEKCKYILDRNIKESKEQPGMFYFDRDPRLKSGPLMNWPLEDIFAHAKRIDVPLMGTKAEHSLVMSNHELINKVREMIQVANSQAEFHDVKGRHHGHLNTPEIFSEIMSRFIVKHAGPNRKIDAKIFDAIRHVE